MKTARTNPCPCGSGKPYSVCCGRQEGGNGLLPDHLRTGTPVDEYLALLQAIALYHETIAQFDEEGRELARVNQLFESTYRPGSSGGVSDSLYVPWLYFDVPFGRERQTVCERFLQSATDFSLNDPGPTLLKQMSDSYVAFYEVLKATRDRITFRELGTGMEWKVSRTVEPSKTRIRKGDIWFIRFVGPPGNAYIFSTPYIFPASSVDDLEETVKKQWQAVRTLQRPRTGVDDSFRRFCKATLTAWADFLLAPQEAKNTQKEARPKSVRSKPPGPEGENREYDAAQLHSNPEIREFLRQQAEDYYHEEWVREKIPALSGLTPLEAASSKENRKQVEALLDGIEDMQESRPEDPFRVDVNGLRRILGLPEKKKH